MDNKPGSARERENKAMDVLADVVLGREIVDFHQVPESARQLGYLASLAKDGTFDPERRLAAFVRRCRMAMEPLPSDHAVRPDDPVQRAWGAAWAVDAAKVRRELPLHIMKRRRLSGL